MSLLRKTVGLIINKNNNHLLNRKKKLDADASSYFILQMNNVQQLFDFQIINEEDFDPHDPNIERINRISTAFGIIHSIANEKYQKLDDIYEKFSNFINEYSKAITTKPHTECTTKPEPDYWIFIGSENLPGNHFNHTKKMTDGKILSLITTYDWEESFSPPSVFEYLAIAILDCSISSIFQQYNIDFPIHCNTKGCIQDYTGHKLDKKILVSNPQYCIECVKTILKLELEIRKNGDQALIIPSIRAITSRVWMGSPSKEDTPMYNLKKHYHYDVDVNSGFYRSKSAIWFDTAREKIIEVLIKSSIAAIAGFLIGLALSQSHTSNDYFQQFLDFLKNNA